MAARKTQTRRAPEEEPAAAERTPLVDDPEPELSETADDAENSDDPVPVDSDPDVDGGDAEQTTDYTRCGGHVLTDKGWVPEDLVEALGATRTHIDA